MARWKSILALALILWLPLQGIASVAMPFCRHAERTDVSAAFGTDAYADYAPGAHRDGSQHHHDASEDSHNAGHGSDHGSILSCNDCGTCQLACAPAVPSPLWQALAPPATSQRIAIDPSALLTFVPEQPNPPPLRG